MNWWMILGAGLLAGATTCAATQGGLLVGLIARQRKAAGNSAPKTLVDDLRPTASFLVGKLVSHTLLGAVLGALGSAFAINPRVSSMLQWLVGLLMIGLGLGAAGVPGFREIKFAPPESWTSWVRSSTKSKSAGAPAMLGFSTVVIPCGVTISIELMAAASGSALAGAAVMAVFVIGTMPMFAVFGVLAQKLTVRFRFLSTAMGVLVVLIGGYTINGALVAMGSPYSVQSLLAGERPTPTASATVTGEEQVITIDAQNTAFVPNVVSAKAGVPTKLVFRTEGVWSCIRSIVVPSLNMSVQLPSDGETEVDLGVLEPGDLAISCSMGMYTMTLQVV